MTEFPAAPAPAAEPAVAPVYLSGGLGRRWGSFLRTAVPLIVVIVALSLYTDSRNSAFLTSKNLQDVLAVSAVLGILSVGQTFLLVGGQLDLSVGSLVSLVGVVGAKEYQNGWSTPEVVLSSLAIGVAAGLLWGIIVTTLRVPPFILTLGGLSIFSSLALVIASSRPIPLTSALSTLGFGKWLGLRAPATLMFAVILVGIVLLHFTRFGRNTFALGSSPQASFLAGLPTRRLIIELFVLNGALASIAGIVLLARLAAGDPTGGQGLELSTIAAIVLGGASLAGGRGSIVGSFLGVLVFGVVQTSLTFLNISGAYQNLVSGGILVIAVTATAASDLFASRRSGGSRAAGLKAIVERLASRPAKISS